MWAANRVNDENVPIYQLGGIPSVPPTPGNVRAMVTPADASAADPQGRPNPLTDPGAFVKTILGETAVAMLAVVFIAIAVWVLLHE